MPENGASVGWWFLRVSAFLTAGTIVKKETLLETGGHNKIKIVLRNFLRKSLT